MSGLDEIRDRLEAATPGPWEPMRAGLGTRVVHEEEGWLTLVTPVLKNSDDAEFIAHAPEDMGRLLAAVEAVTALHKPEKRWMPYDGADCSFDTEDEARDASADVDLGVAAMESIIANGYPYFEVCAHCKTIEDGPCDGECTRENGYRECLWPCPTVKAITAALEGKS